MSAHEEALEVKGLKRRRVGCAKSMPLTEQSLLELEQSQPGYRRFERLLDHWAYYLESTTQDFFETYFGSADPDYYPLCFEKERGELPLSRADFSESHITTLSSADF